MDGVVRARRRRPLPVVLSRQEVLRVFRELRGVPLLITGILYGSGLRLTECLRLRVKDIEFEKHHIFVRGGKGRKDRRAILPLRLEARLLAAVRRLHAKDLLAGAGFVELPYALARKYPNAPRSWPYQWVFPASRTYVDPTSGQRRRHHLHQTVVQKAVRQAVLRADIQKPAGCHTFRHYAGCRIMPSARPRAALCLGFSLSNPA
jgi:integrase